MELERTKYDYQVEAVFKKYYGALCYYSSRYISDPEVVQDLVQDVFVKLIEHRQAFETPEHLRNFLYLSVKNNCFNYHQKGVLKEKHEYLIREYTPEVDFPDEEVLTAEVFRRLKEAVDELPAECRKICYMSYFEGLDNEKIAEQLHISVNTVRAQKMRGKKLLRDRLKYLLPLLLLCPELFH